MIYARINLIKNKDEQMQGGWRYLPDPDPLILDSLYLQYCRHKKFPSYMPIFYNEYSDTSNDVIGYYDDYDQLIAFSLIRRHDKHNAECIQFAWNYDNPKRRLGIESLKHEAALYRDRGFKYLYLGEADEYKNEIDGFEIMGPV